MEISIFAAILKWYMFLNFFFFFLFANLWLFKVYTDMVQVLCQNSLGLVFTGVQLCTNKSSKDLMHLSYYCYLN